jgi:regulator of sigma E protease
MTLLLTIVIFAVIITVLVFIHEFGHFAAAKLSGVAVHEFAIGFGPTIFSKFYKGTNYKINILPFGGYVQLEGEDDTSTPNSFRNKRLRVKAFVLMAGIFMNLVLAVILLGIYLANNAYRFAIPHIVDYQFTNTSFQKVYFPLIITFVDPEGPSVGKLEEQEIIVSANNIEFSSLNEFLQILKDNQGKEIEFTFINFNTFELSNRKIQLGMADENGSILKVGLVPYDSQSGRKTYFLKYNEGPFAGVSMTYDAFIYQFKALGGLVTNAVRTGDYKEVSNSVGGLPAIGNQVGQLVEFQAYDVLIPLTALFSVNLAMFNILPFPALDGGQLLFATIEKIRRKKFSDKFLNRVNFTGFVILMSFGLLVTLKDIIQLNWIGNIFEGIRSVFGR